MGNNIRIFISPFSKAMRYGDNKVNPKTYPYWEELIPMMEERYNVTQLIGDSSDLVIAKRSLQLPLKGVINEVKSNMDSFVSIDNFFPHLCHYYNKRGFVIFGQSDPNLFGYKENINILKDRNNLRKEQFWHWEQTPYNTDVFPTAKEVFEILTIYIK